MASGSDTMLLELGKLRYSRWIKAILVGHAMLLMRLFLEKMIFRKEPWPGTQD